MVMMKKSLKVVVVALMLVVCMAGCGKEQDELLEYINGDARKEVTELETKAKASYSSVSGDNYKDDETMLQEFSTNTADLAKQVVDKATALGEKLEGEGLKKVHEVYVNSLKNFQSGVDQIIKALKDGDTDLASQGSDMIGKANEETSSYEEKLKKLAEDLDVELKGLER